MNTHEQLHQYFRDSCRNDTGSIKEAYELSLAAEKHYAAQEAEIVNLKERIASQANMIDKLQVKAGHVDLLREALAGISEQTANGFVICPKCNHQDSTEGHDVLWMANEALEQTKGI